MSKVYIVQHLHSGHVYAIFLHYKDAKKFIKDNDPNLLLTVPKRVIENYQEDLKENEGF